VDALLNKENIYYRDLARDIADQHIRPIAAELDRSGEYPWSVIKALQEAEMMGMWIPKDYGGKGSGLLNLCIVCEELSRACGGIGCTYVVNALGSFPIILGGTEEQKKKYLPDIAAGEKLIAFALSEKSAGSDAGSLKTRAEREDLYGLCYGQSRARHQRCDRFYR
jgi:alkylation response protein AidB-like acyl-CoA dehydrogenase